LPASPSNLQQKLSPAEPASEPAPQITAEKFARLRLNPALLERRTTTDYIASALRVAIYDGQFSDGEELNQVELAQHFRVSRVPIREALRQLQAEGLVRNEAHRQTVVVGLELDDIVQLIEARAVLESHLLRRAGPRIGADTLERLRGQSDEMSRPGEYDYDWVVKNWEFHRSLYELSGLPAIVELAEQLHLKVERYARRAGSTDRRVQAAEEHRRIVEAIAARNFADAGAELERHILNTGEAIRKHAKSGRSLRTPGA
jgi:DNA-binding GntR family transcriptional regulator